MLHLLNFLIFYIFRLSQAEYPWTLAMRYLHVYFTEADIMISYGTWMYHLYVHISVFSLISYWEGINDDMGGYQ